MSSKNLSKTEILLAVWRLHDRGCKESEIIDQLKLALAIYMGNPRKAREAAAIEDPEQQRRFYLCWFHGTVGGYMIAAADLGKYIRQEMLKTHLEDEGQLPDGEVLNLRCTRGRIDKLRFTRTKCGRDRLIAEYTTQE